LRILDIDDLIDAAELVTYVHDRILHDDLPRAEDLTAQAMSSQPESPSPYAARAMLRQTQGRYEEAQFDWFQASQRIQFSEAFLLRRAQLAALSGDRAGAMAHMRKLLDLYPNIGHHLWFYALLSDTEESRAMARVDVERAVNRLHPDERPYDFLVAVHRVLGSPLSAQQALKKGLSQHCLPLDRGSPRANCRAWYHALAGQHLPRSERQIKRALNQDPRRSDYLDTLAQVMLARGELTEAREAAHLAATLDPDDPYLMWRLQHVSTQPPPP
jgi:tetratricopeptide (TPR) repeat protein